MRYAILLGALLLAGCQNTVGPFAPREPQRVDDPLLSIPEQQQRGRDRLSLPEDERGVSPRTFMERPGPHGR
jgi:hypothetical protein